ncbi:hypothetical protein [Bradyrhizobium canariense]|nr:hypothetical protein [Bradyrhizobium canariense]
MYARVTPAASRLVADQMQMQMVWHIEVTAEREKRSEAFAENAPIREGE